eukprot:6172049-Pyramimonas_sp.AAC.1
MIGSHVYAYGRPTLAGCTFPSDVDSMDTVTCFYYSLQTARECGWGKTPTGIVCSVNFSSAPNHDTVVDWKES